MAIVAKSSKFGKYGRPTLAWIVGLLFFFPIFWLVLTSFKTDADAVKPEHLIWFTLWALVAIILEQARLAGWESFGVRYLDLNRVIGQ